MDFNQLMELIQGDEEITCFDLYENDCLINIVTIEGKKLLDIHLFERYDDEYTLAKETLNNNGMKYYRLDDLKLKSERITGDAAATCIFSLNDDIEGKSSMKARIVQEYFELTDIDAFIAIIRRAGKKSLKIAFFLDPDEYKLLSSFLNCNSVDFSELYDELMQEHLEVKLDVRWNFVPLEAKSEY